MDAPFRELGAHRLVRSDIGGSPSSVALDAPFRELGVQRLVALASPVVEQSIMRTGGPLPSSVVAEAEAMPSSASSGSLQTAAVRPQATLPVGRLDEETVPRVDEELAGNVVANEVEEALADKENPLDKLTEAELRTDLQKYIDEDLESKPLKALKDNATFDVKQLKYDEKTHVLSWQLQLKPDSKLTKAQAQEELKNVFKSFFGQFKKWVVKDEDFDKFWQAAKIDVKTANPLDQLTEADLRAGLQKYMEEDLKSTPLEALKANVTFDVQKLTYDETTCVLTWQVQLKPKSKLTKAQVKDHLKNVFKSYFGNFKGWLVTDEDFDKFWLAARIDVKDPPVATPPDTPKVPVSPKPPTTPPGAPTAPPVVASPTAADGTVPVIYYYAPCYTPCYVPMNCGCGPMRGCGIFRGRCR